MTLLDLIILGALGYFIFTRFTNSPLTGKKSKKVEIKVIKGKAESKQQLEKLLSQAKENSKIDKEQQLKEKAESLEGLEKVKVYDESFSEDDFLNGAKKAYSWFYDCLNKDDEAMLEQIVSPKIYNQIVKQLDDLDDKGQHKITTILELEQPIILDCTTHAKTAFIDVRYNAKLEVVIINEESKEEISKTLETQKVVWTWARNIVSTDPNWQLDGIKNVS